MLVEKMKVLDGEMVEFVPDVYLEEEIQQADKYKENPMGFWLS